MGSQEFEADLTESPAPSSDSGIALALSGGGYRAMLFHVGAIWRLNEVGLLTKLARISSVSGGSITAGYLGLLWNSFVVADGRADLAPFVEGMRAMADRTVDAGAVLGGIFLPGDISDHVASVYDEVLFKGATLASLPDDAGGNAPRFVINATNIGTSAVWRFSRQYMGDYRVGLILQPDIPLCQAVAASSAFPPFLSPMSLPIAQPVVKTKGADLSFPPFTENATLSDGGVYDNLGVETLKRFGVLLVSDAGQKIKPEESPHHDWARHSLRVLDTIDNQVRSLRKRMLIESYDKDRKGCYWGIGSDFAKFALQDDPLGCRSRDPRPLAEMSTRLQKLPRASQNKLMNWGYAICDAALRAHISPVLQSQLGIAIRASTSFPFPDEY